MSQPPIPTHGGPTALTQAPAERPRFRKKRSVVPGALGAFMVVAVALSGCSDTGAGQAPVTAPASTPITGTEVPAPAETTQEATETEAPAPVVNPFDERYGTFETVTTSGDAAALLGREPGAT